MTLSTRLRALLEGEGVTQADRDAAARYGRAVGVFTYRECEEIIAGNNDDCTIVDRFSAHRLSDPLRAIMPEVIEALEGMELKLAEAEERYSELLIAGLRNPKFNQVKGLLVHFGCTSCGCDDLLILDGGTANQLGSGIGSVNALDNTIGSGQTGRSALTLSVLAHPDSVAISSIADSAIVGRGFRIGLLRNGLGFDDGGMIDGFLRSLGDGLSSLHRSLVRSAPVLLRRPPAP